ncbi:pentatricopeptide repeat-containing protein At1g71210, mitochondrial-like [Pyrus communis]|uniref:pentatricopeptide repeat-containing protein At1g71210, mitochondrial-like n=1 Tax=Pyrus communis TaxID=23211 RepID=UPI0035BEDB0E
MLISLRNLAKSKANTNCSLCCSSTAILDATFLLTTTAAAAATRTSSISGCCSFSFGPNAPPTPAPFSTSARLTPARDVVLSFKEWFNTRNDALFDHIFLILKSSTDDDVLALSHLSVRLSESFVLEVLRYGSNDHDVLSCLKFFDWAGRQPGFHHTRATFNAIFKILSKAKLMSLMLDVLSTYSKQRYAHTVRFHDTLVMGYAVAGKPDIALQLFGKMRFHGLDLDSFAYHVLLNALVEESCFDAVQVIAKQISLRGFENEITHSIMLKWLCKQKLLDQAEAYLRQLVSDGKPVTGHAVSVLVDALCKHKKFQQAGELVDEFRDLGVALMESAYGVWIRDLVQAGRLDGALEFFQKRKSLEGYVPDAFRYNTLICSLLKEDHLEEVCDLLMEMKENKISPDKVTMNAALCFFCKAGMVDVALELYNSRSEFRLTPNSMVYNYLINVFCGEGSIDEAYRVMKHSVEQGYFTGRKTFSILADSLCREGKLEKMKELVTFALERNFMPSNSTYDKFITTLCRTKRVEDAYLIHGELNRINKGSTKSTYFSLINGFNGLSKGDIAARLLIEMQEKGHLPTRKLFKDVICCLCDMENPDEQFFNLLEMQLSCREPSCDVYNFFIYGAGYAKRPDLARQVYEMMQRSGIQPNLRSDVIMLQSYLKGERISDALNFFNDLHERRKVLGRRLYSALIVGLCKAQKAEIAVNFLMEMKEKGVVPSDDCYEFLIQLLCWNKEFDMAVNLINDLEKVGRHITSFTGNILLLHSLKTPELYNSWVRLREEQNEMSGCSMLGLLIGAFSGRIQVSQDIGNLEEVIEKCFPLDVFTHNMLIRRLSQSNMEHACALFDKMCQKGYEPNRWTYDAIVQGFLKHGRTSEAKRWVEVMYRKGFYPTRRTNLLL